MTKKNVFMDHAVIRVLAGRGGNGSSHFRREKFVPLGGPDGGDGGKGGDVVLAAEAGLRTLIDFAYRKEYQAPGGNPGEGSRKSGRKGQDLVIHVPVGTLVLSREGELLADLSQPGSQFVAAKGGRGGLGNQHFATPERRSPTLAEKGQPGEERDLVLELKLLADVGLVGLPNAGKSTLLASVSAAHPKIADYPFTTLTPNLGRVRIDEHADFVMVDIPGLIEGASQGSGLGHEFLRHVERTKLLIHLVDVGFPGVEPVKDFETVNHELKLYDSRLAARPQLVALNKIDLLQDPAEIERLVETFRKMGHEVFPISAAARQGLAALTKRAFHLLKTLPEGGLVVPEYRKRAEPEERFTITAVEPGVWRVRGKEVEKWVAMTDFDNEEGVAKLKNIFDRIGLTEAFREKGLQPGDTVMVGKEAFEYQED